MFNITWTYADGDTVTSPAPLDLATELFDVYLYLAETADFYGRTVEFADDDVPFTAPRILVRAGGELYATITETITIEEED